MKILKPLLWAVLMTAGFWGTGCQTLPTLDVQFESGPLRVDGVLDEARYAATPPLESFAVACNPGKPAPSTKAWLFWNDGGLEFAFECVESTPIAKAPSENEQDVDPQDRAELFLWSGDANGTYYCLEIAPLGAVHDYAARFYRKFDNSWSPAGWQCATTSDEHSYRVEASISRAALEQCGFALKPGGRIRAGLFRADFASWDPAVAPDWISWVDARTPQPDFHVAAAFGRLVFKPASNE